MDKYNILTIVVLVLFLGFIISPLSILCDGVWRYLPDSFELYKGNKSFLDIYYSPYVTIFYYSLLKLFSQNFYMFNTIIKISSFIYLVSLSFIVLKLSDLIGTNNKLLAMILIFFNPLIILSISPMQESYALLFFLLFIYFIIKKEYGKSILFFVLFSITKNVFIIYLPWVILLYYRDLLENISVGNRKYFLFLLLITPTAWFMKNYILTGSIFGSLEKSFEIKISKYVVLSLVTRLFGFPSPNMSNAVNSLGINQVYLYIFVILSLLSIFILLKKFFTLEKKTSIEKWLIIQPLLTILVFCYFFFGHRDSGRYFIYSYILLVLYVLRQRLNKFEKTYLYLFSLFMLAFSLITLVYFSYKENMIVDTCQLDNLGGCDYYIKQYFCKYCKGEYRYFKLDLLGKMFFIIL